MSDREKNPDMEEMIKNSAKYPERASDDSNRSPFEGVYAGPQMPVAMLTYAGPQFMNNNIGISQGSPFALAPTMQQQLQFVNKTVGPDKKICDKCGSTVAKESNFCPECGSKFDMTTTDKAENENN